MIAEPIVREAALRQLRSERQSKVLLAWIHPGMVHSDFAMGLVDTATFSPEIEQVAALCATGMLAQARNQACEYGLEKVPGFEVIVFADTDVAFRGWMVEALANRVGLPGVDVCGAVINAEDRKPILYGLDQKRLWTSPKADEPIGGIGMGLTAIHRRVLDAGVRFSTRTDEEFGFTSEDRAFCIDALAAGFEIRCDRTVHPSHMKIVAL